MRGAQMPAGGDATPTLLSARELAQRWGMSRDTLKRRKREPGFPQPIAPSRGRGRTALWKIEDIVAFEEAGANTATAAAKTTDS